MPSSFGEMFQRKRGCDFKKGWMRLPICDQLANARQSRRDFIFRNHFTVHTDSLAESDEVRRDEEAGAIFPCPTDRIDHGADRPLAVCSRDVDDAWFSRSFRRGAGNGTRGACDLQINVQLADETLDVLQPELDPEALKAIEPGERLRVIDCRVSRRANPRGLARPSRSAPAS